MSWRLLSPFNVVHAVLRLTIRWRRTRCKQGDAGISSFDTCISCRCPNAGVSSKGKRHLPYLKQWTSIYLKDARIRLQSQLQGYDLSFEDLYVFQELCAYEVSC